MGAMILESLSHAEFNLQRSNACKEHQNKHPRSWHSNVNSNAYIKTEGQATSAGVKQMAVRWL